MGRKKLLSLFVAVLTFLSNAVFAYAVETNLWSDRKKPTQLASLPVSTPLPVPSAIAPSVKKPSLKLPKNFPSRYTNVLSSLPAAYGTIRKVTVPAQSKDNRFVIHIQDIHQNLEAQTNIGQTVLALADQPSIGVVGLEGAFEPIDLSKLRSYPRMDIRRKVADYLLEQNQISGPIHSALTREKVIPSFVGIDDREHYRANVQAYKDSASLQSKMLAQLDTDKKNLRETKLRIFNSNLLSFDQSIQSFHDGKQPLGAYVRQLSARDSELSPMAELFLEALDSEEKLQLSRVESERSSILSALVPTLTSEQSKDLVDHSLAYRLGSINHADFYRFLKSLCEKQGITWSKYPAMLDYMQYVLLSDSIDAERLFGDLREMEGKIYVSLVKNEEEKELVKHTRELYLREKLILFSLSKGEWDEYTSALGRHPGGSRDPGRRTPLKKRAYWTPSSDGVTTFEDFYIQAEARDIAMSENLLKAMSQSNTQVAVLVTGGFHAQGISRQLTNAGATVVTFVPTLTKVESESGSAYLSAFTREKTPLDKLFEGDKLFLATPPSLGAGNGTAAVLSRTLDRSAEAEKLVPPHLQVSDVPSKPNTLQVTNLHNRLTQLISIEDTKEKILNVTYELMDVPLKSLLLTAVTWKAIALLGVKMSWPQASVIYGVFFLILYLLNQDWPYQWPLAIHERAIAGIDQTTWEVEWLGFFKPMQMKAEESVGVSLAPSNLEKHVTEAGNPYNRKYELFKDYWNDHIAKSREGILEGARLAPKDSITIIGVSNAKEIPLIDLVRQFDVVKLIDIDRDSLMKTLDLIPEDLRSKVKLEVRDITGGQLTRFTDEALKIIKGTPADKPREAFERLLFHYKSVTFSIPNDIVAEFKASYVVSSMLITQLIYYPDEMIRMTFAQKFGLRMEEAMPYLEERTPLQFKVVKNHVETLEALTKDGGIVYLSDSVAETPLLRRGFSAVNQLYVSRLLANLLRTWDLNSFLNAAGKQELISVLDHLTQRSVKLSADAIINGLKTRTFSDQQENLVVAAFSLLIGKKVLPIEKEIEFIKAMVHHSEQTSEWVRAKMIPPLNELLFGLFEPVWEGKPWLWITDPRHTAAGNGQSFQVEAMVLKKTKIGNKTGSGSWFDNPYYAALQAWWGEAVIAYVAALRLSNLAAQFVPFAWADSVAILVGLVITAIVFWAPHIFRGKDFMRSSPVLFLTAAYAIIGIPFYGVGLTELFHLKFTEAQVFSLTALLFVTVYHLVINVRDILDDFNLRKAPKPSHLAAIAIAFSGYLAGVFFGLRFDSLDIQLLSAPVDLWVLVVFGGILISMPLFVWWVLVEEGRIARNLNKAYFAHIENPTLESRNELDDWTLKYLSAIIQTDAEPSTINLIRRVWGDLSPAVKVELLKKIREAHEDVPSRGDLLILKITGPFKENDSFIPNIPSQPLSRAKKASLWINLNMFWIFVWIEASFIVGTALGGYGFVRHDTPVNNRPVTKRPFIAEEPSLQERAEKVNRAIHLMGKARWNRVDFREAGKLNRELFTEPDSPDNDIIYKFKRTLEDRIVHELDLQIVVDTINDKNWDYHKLRKAESILDHHIERLTVDQVKRLVPMVDDLQNNRRGLLTKIENLMKNQPWEKEDAIAALRLLLARNDKTGRLMQWHEWRQLEIPAYASLETILVAQLLSAKNWTQKDVEAATFLLTEVRHMLSPYEAHQIEQKLEEHQKKTSQRSDRGIEDLLGPVIVDQLGKLNSDGVGREDVLRALDREFNANPIDASLSWSQLVYGIWGAAFVRLKPLAQTPLPDVDAWIFAGEATDSEVERIRQLRAQLPKDQNVLVFTRHTEYYSSRLGSTIYVVPEGGRVLNDANEIDVVQLRRLIQENALVQKSAGTTEGEKNVVGLMTGGAVLTSVQDPFDDKAVQGLVRELKDLGISWSPLDVWMKGLPAVGAMGVVSLLLSAVLAKKHA